MPWFSQEAPRPEPAKQIHALAQRLLDEARSRLKVDFRRVLLLPPDLTRAHSGVGIITEMIYNLLPKTSTTPHVIPTLGQHVPHTPAENRWMFGDIPSARIHAHDWRNGVTRVGVVPASIVKEYTAGKVDWEIPMDLNVMLMKEKWDLIVNLGHVVPHECSASPTTTKTTSSASPAKTRSAPPTWPPPPGASKIISATSSPHPRHLQLGRGSLPPPPARLLSPRSS